MKTSIGKLRMDQKSSLVNALQNTLNTHLTVFIQNDSSMQNLPVQQMMHIKKTPVFGQE